jgi:NAD(P)H-dependent FMN reductase
MKIQVILGSTRPNRASDKVAAWVMEEAKKIEGFEFELVDLKDFPLPMYDEPVTVKQIQGNYKHEEVKTWSKKISEGDGYIFITPEYNHGYTAVLKNALDWLYDEWNNKPAAFVSYGGIAAGTRAVGQLVQVFRELQMVPLRDGAHLPMIWTAFDQAGTFKSDFHVPDLSPMFASLTKWVPLLKSLREQK